MTEPLRLMIYDGSDVTTNIRRIVGGLTDEPGKVLDVIGVKRADFDVPLGLTHSWTAGGRVYRALGRIDECAGFMTWNEALLWLATVEPGRKISQIQFWGHGSPGRVWMLQDGVLDANAFSEPYAETLMAIRARLTEDALIWFRSCSVFQGRAGHDFARAWSRGMDCRVASHTHVVGFWQAGLHGLSPGQEPGWSLDEGVGLVSRWSSPNRTWFMGNVVPENW